MARPGVFQRLHVCEDELTKCVGAELAMSTHHNLASSLAPQLSSWECCRVLSRVTRLEKRTIKEKNWIILVGTDQEKVTTVFWSVGVYVFVCVLELR